MRKSIKTTIDNLARVSQFLRDLGALVGHLRKARAGLNNSATFLDDLANFLRKDEVDRMRIEKVIHGLTQQRDAARAQAARLQQQVDALTPQVPDAGDLAALSAAEADIAADTTLGGAGGDTTTGGTGTDTTGGG